MANNSERVFLRLSDVYGVSNDELKAVLGSEIEVVGITRGSPSVEHAAEECAVVTLLGDRRSIKPQIEHRFEAFRHPDREPFPDFDFKGFTPLTKGHAESDGGLIEYCETSAIHTQLTDHSVIAVAGLGGNAFATWQSAKLHHFSHWLRDYLPGDLPNTRVWIYGYRSELSDDTNMASTLHFAELLRLDLITYAERYNMQNIVLMGHSLGCILIKRALVDLPPEHELFSTLVALVFFGAPHKGLNIEALSDYAFTTLRQQRAQTIISELGAHSAFLGSLHRDFINRLDDSLPHIITVYETQTTPTLAQDPGTGKWTRTGPEKYAVSLDSAKLDLQKRYETLLPAPYNHSGIAKVTKDAGHVYWRLVGVLKDLIKKRNSNSALTVSSDSVSGTTSSSQEFRSAKSTGESSLNSRLPPMARWLPSNVEQLLALPDSSWTSVPSEPNAMNAALLKALHSGSITKLEDISLLLDPPGTQVQANTSPSDTISTPISPPSLTRVVTLSPSTSIESSLSATQISPLSPRIKRREVPKSAPRSTLSTIFPTAGFGFNLQLVPQKDTFRDSGSVISVETLEDQPLQLSESFPEVVKRNDWPIDLSSLPSITLRPASLMKDYKPFRFEPITRYLHHPTLVVVVKRHGPAAASDNTGIAPIKFKTHTVSDPHCEFSYRNGQWFLRDVGSSNGTWLDGVRLSLSKEESPRHLVRDQALVELGKEIGDGKDHGQRRVRLIVDFSDP